MNPLVGQSRDLPRLSRELIAAVVTMCFEKKGLLRYLAGHMEAAVPVRGVVRGRALCSADR